MTTTVRITVTSDDAEFLIEERVDKIGPFTETDAVRSAVARATNRARLAYGVRSNP